MILKNRFGIYFLLVIGLYLSPAFLGFANHLTDSRIVFILGTIILCASVWEYGDPENTNWPTFLVATSAIMLILSGFLLGSMGHIYLFGVGLIIGVPILLFEVLKFMYTRSE